MCFEKNVPEIRFDGFSGEWDAALLKDVSTYSNGGSFENDVKAEGKYELVTLKSVDMNGNLVSSGRYIDVEVPTLPKDTLVMILSEQSPGLLGMTARIPVSDKYVLNQRVAEIRPLNNIESYFLSMAVNRNQRYFSERGAGTKVQNISKPNVENYEFLIPRKEEQTAIGNTFQKLDNLINQHQQKHDKLSNIKKAMLDKMFPKQGETIPEIRFKGFSAEWEEKKLGELAEIVRGASPRPIEDPKWFDKSSTVGWLRIRDVTEQDGRIHFLEQRISKLGQEKTRVLFEPHLLVSIAASVGKPVINYVETGVHDGFLIFKKPLFELEFMYQWLKSFQEAWQQYGQPGSQVNLNSDIVKGQVVRIPSNAEQLVIGNYFQKLDALINQHQQQITKLNNIKQACLSKMFV